jgi:hypothetical protein
MSDPIDRKLADNLRHWRASGQPQAWCEARQGQWSAVDWRRLISSLWWSEYWPMEPAAIRAVVDELSMPFNLRRWEQSGEPWRWLDSHRGVWTHDDWLALLAALRRSDYWPLDPDAVGIVLGQMHALWSNLQRWKQSGLPQIWVESRQGVWSHADWLALLDTLRQSPFWPLDPGAVGETLEQFKQRYQNLIRWQFSGHPQRWLEARRGIWDELAWRSLVATLEESEYWPLDLTAVARVMESHQREWWNLRRWRDAGLARRWVEAQAGQWNHGDWLTLLASLRSSGYWPIDPAALGQILEEARTEWANLQRWQATSGPGAWVAAHAGSWQATDLDSLLHALWQTEFWPLDGRAVETVLHGLQREHANLGRWEATGAADWVAQHPSGWNHADWLALVHDLRGSAFWPLPLEALGDLLLQRRQALAAPAGQAEGSLADAGPALMRMPDRSRRAA